MRGIHRGISHTTLGTNQTLYYLPALFTENLYTFYKVSSRFSQLSLGHTDDETTRQSTRYQKLYGRPGISRIPKGYPQAGSLLTLGAADQC